MTINTSDLSDTFEDDNGVSGGIDDDGETEFIEDDDDFIPRTFVCNFN